MRVSSYINDVSYLLSSSLSLKILLAIEILNLATPTLIAKAIKCSPSNVSTKLIELRKKGLAICVTPERKKGRIYKLTKKGKIVVSYFDDVKNSINVEWYNLRYDKSKMERI